MPFFGDMRRDRKAIVHMHRMMHGPVGRSVNVQDSDIPRVLARVEKKVASRRMGVSRLVHKCAVAAGSTNMEAASSVPMDCMLMVRVSTVKDCMRKLRSRVGQPIM